jgi:hypothetical protein
MDLICQEKTRILVATYRISQNEATPCSVGTYGKICGYFPDKFGLVIGLLPDAEVNPRESTRKST